MITGLFFAAAFQFRTACYGLSMRSEIEEAIQLLKSAEPDSIEKALALLQQTVFSFSMRVCNQREDAEDTMQEVLAESIPVLPRFESPKALVVWFYKVARSRCLMSRRKSKFAPKQELSLEELMPDREELSRTGRDSRVNPEAFAIRSQEARWLREAIQKLPPQYRMVLVLRDMEGLTDDEVAEITGLRAGTVRVRLHRARLFVRKQLMKPRARPPGARLESAPATATASVPRSGRCKAMFAELSNYLDEQLDDSLCEELEQHLDGCEPCKGFLASLQATIEQCRVSPADFPNAKKAAKLRKQVLENYRRISSLRR
jgi:RNA polymerase sigma-70 factor, ECF subfamily